MFDNKNRYIIENYAEKSTFSSFLPGISGRFGIPIWCFYVNRGQGVTSFGIEDKEHSIMEFFPAHQAYQFTKQLGFRTFLTVNGDYYEPFKEELPSKKMYIGMNEMEVEETSEERKIKTNVLYFTLPGEELGGLVRKVTIQNLDSKAKTIELIDGMPAIIPYGVDVSLLKTMGQTAKAWMQVEDYLEGMPYFRVRTSIKDTADVQEILGGHFYLAMGEDGLRLPVIVDPEVVFEHDTAMENAMGLVKNKLETLLSKKQVTQNNLPCAFFGKKVILEPNECISIYAVIGQVANKEIHKRFSQKLTRKHFFDDKYEENARLTRDLCQVIHTETASPIFDAYCKQTYLDNVLRGGYPVKLGEDKIFHLYSRKHGDIERDYNFFQMIPEYYSQGNGNFRDVNQNRRCDVLFSPFVKAYNVKTFYNLIQIDGYNPLAVQKTTYQVDEKNISQLMDLVSKEAQNAFTQLLRNSFTPGKLLEFLAMNQEMTQDSLQSLLETILAKSKQNVNAIFGEGYWSDHWTYNLDLIETYLMVYPDFEKELLIEDKTYTYFESKAVIKPRKARYVETKSGVRQYNAVDHDTKKNISHDQVRCQYGKGGIFYSNLMGKLILLNVTKMAALDPYGLGIEMEGGKPGWYDALNGLPGIFGSSMCETYELCRMLQFTVGVLEKYNEEQELPIELVELMKEIHESIVENGNEKAGEKAGFQCWNRMNDAKEAYRDRTLWGLDGRTQKIPAKELIVMLAGYMCYVQAGIEKALEYGNGISPAYFAYELTDYERQQGEIVAKEFRVIVMPHFLEGPVRYLKLNSADAARVLVERVKQSALFDTKLQMYKVNESLESASFEIGRAKAFTPGWLENESIWLHMEYKYLLEIFKAGLYKEFFTDFQKQCVPFINAQIYGRSPLENSSFIASSANPNEKFHGKGFVARLSGSTAEFIHLWQLMMFGKQPFTNTENGLELTFAPAIGSYLIGEEKRIVCTFLGSILVEYRVDQKVSLIPGQYEITQILISYNNGINHLIKENRLMGGEAEDVRSGKVSKIQIAIKTVDDYVENIMD